MQSKKNSAYYVGASTNPFKRELEHNSGKTKSTRNKGPWKVIFTQEFSSITLAKQIEYKLKMMKSRKILEKIIQDGFIRISS